MKNSLFAFDFADSNVGIVKFEVVVQDADEAMAFSKLLSYLSSLKSKTFCIIPQPLKGTSDSKVIIHELFRRLANIPDPIAYIITTHLFTEHWLNQILLKFCPHRDLTTHRYAVKLDLAYGIGKLSEDLFHNLTNLNRLRNQIAHRLDFDLTQMALDYRGCPPDFEISGYRPTFDPKGEQHHISNVLGVVMTHTFGMLHNHCVKNLGLGKPLASYSCEI